jgi:tRNA A37 methylthiotransferase MiaB
MRRFGSTTTFLDLLGEIRDRNPAAGVRTNVIVGFPGESEWDLRELERFLEAARFDVVGVFGYSDEDGTEAASFADKLDPEEVADRVERLQAVVDELVSQRAEERVGETVDVLIESPDGEGRAAHQGPDVDGTTTLRDWKGEVGKLLSARVVEAHGADLVAEALPVDHAS